MENIIVKYNIVFFMLIYICYDRKFNIKEYQDYVIIYKNKSVNNQSIAFTTCYKDNKKNFNWIFMIDIDDYLIIKNNTLINYLSEETFEKQDFIKIHWLYPTSKNNNLQYYIHTSSETFERNISCNNAG